MGAARLEPALFSMWQVAKGDQSFTDRFKNFKLTPQNRSESTGLGWTAGDLKAAQWTVLISVLTPMQMPYPFRPSFFEMKTTTLEAFFAVSVINSSDFWKILAKSGARPF